MGRADGLWRVSLLDSAQFPMPETSGSAFFCYALAWGINNGYLESSEYRQTVLLAWEGLVSNVDENGVLLYVQPTGFKPVKFDPNDPSLRTRLYSAGAFLLAGNEIAKLVEPTEVERSLKRAQISVPKKAAHFLSGTGMPTHWIPQTQVWDVLGRKSVLAPNSARNRQNAVRVLVIPSENRTSEQ